MRAAGEVKCSGVGRDWNCYRCGEQSHFSRDCTSTNTGLAPKLDRKNDPNVQLLIARRDLSVRNQGSGGEKNKTTAVKVTFEDKTDTEESGTTNARPLWRDDHLTVPDGPGWVFSTTDGHG